jgi:transcriptional regulator with XRE-family HTH domain
MTPEIKKALGRLIKNYRGSWNWTQERLAGAADVNLRTVQRAECGQGLSKENLSAIAAAFNLDEKRLIDEAKNAGEAPPELRFALRKVELPHDLIKILKDSIKGGHSLEIGPPDEHRFNEFIGEHLAGLSAEVENPPSGQSLEELHNSARYVLGLCRQMGFSLFAGNYTEDIKAKRRTRRQITTLLIAAPDSDPRVRKNVKGLELDMVRDSRRLLRGRLFGRMTPYDWMEDQLIGKSDGEFNVKDVLRRMLSEMLGEINEASRRKAK